MGESLEGRLRAIVAERLGVDPCDLTSDVSLADDLAVDSLDLLDVAVAIERACDVVLPDAVLEGVRSFGDLIDTTVLLVAQREARAREGHGPEAPLVRARVVPAHTVEPRPLERVAHLTPYEAQTLADDALREGPGTLLDLTLPPDAPRQQVDRLRLAFDWLATRGVTVRCHRDGERDFGGTREWSAAR